MSDNRPGAHLMSAESLIDYKVVNMNGDDLGNIESIMLDIDNHTIAYAVLSFGGLLGIGEKFFAVPWEALRLDAKNKEMVLDVDKERLENAPGFDKNNFPDMANLEWAASIHSFYKRRPYWERFRHRM